jgi:hypothetical protein
MLDFAGDYYEKLISFNYWLVKASTLSDSGSSPPI